jgi:DNA-binding NarL/FixJ family response regulator
MTVTGPKLVGRSAEVEAIEGALADLAHSRPVAIQLAGEPGIGKTRLLVELGARAEQRGHLVLKGSASELEGELPFAVFVDVLDEYLQGLPAGVLAGLDEETRVQLGHVFPSLPPPPADLPVERFRIHRALSDLLQALAGTGRLVLLLDDVQWADSGSVDLLGMLLRRPPTGVMIAMAVRPRQLPERLAGAVERAVSDRVLTRLEVDRLSVPEATELVGEALPEGIYEQSGGNPFYLQQLLRFPGRGTAEAISDELWLVTPGVRRVLEGAAVVGDPFELDLAAAAAGVSEAEMLEALDELLAADLVRHTQVPRRFAFRHPLIRQAVYEATPGGWRIGAHERAGAALADRGAPAEVLAHHVEQAGRHGDAEAIAILSQAGHSVARRTPAGAARWYTAALRLLPLDAPAAERIELLSATAGAAAAAGRFEEARSALFEAERLVSPDDAIQSAGLGAALARVEDLMSRHEEARRRLEAATETLDALPAAQAVAVLQQLVMNAVFRRDHDDAGAWARRACEVARRSGERPLLASATASLAFVAAMAAEIEEASEACDEAAALVDAMPDAEAATCVLGLCHLGAAELHLDRLGDGDVHTGRALAIARSTGQVQLFPMVAPLVGWALSVSGRLAEAREVQDGATEEARLTGSAHALAWILNTRAMTALNRGDLEAAVADGAESVELTGRLDPRSGIAAYTGVVYGIALGEMGEPARGIQIALDRGGGPTLPLIPGGWRAFFLERLLPAWLALGRSEEARAAVAEAEAVADETGLGSARSSALRARARLALDEGDAAAAARAAGAAIEIAETAGMAMAAGISRLLAGRALAADGHREEAVPMLERAAADLDACGAIRLRGEAERELGKLGRRRPRRSPRTTPAPEGDGVETLSARELEVARLIVDRQTNAQIAEELFLSPKTVETHVRHLFEKLSVSSRVEVARVIEVTERAAKNQGAGSG